MHIFERKVNGYEYRIAAQSIWDSSRGRSVARQAVLGPAGPPPVVDLSATRTVGTRFVGDVGALTWIAEQLDAVTRLSGDRGARELLGDGPRIECGDIARIGDVDTVSDLEAVRGEASPSGGVDITTA